MRAFDYCPADAMRSRPCQCQVLFRWPSASPFLAALLVFLVALAACTSGNGSATPSSTMRSFMLAGEGRDLETAHSLLAMDADAQEIDSLLRDPVLFDGFQDLKVDRWMVYAPPDSDRGKLTGSLAYRGGFTGKFDADLVQGKEGWRISRLSLVVSRDKLQQYQPGETPVPGGTPGARQGRPAGG